MNTGYTYDPTPSQRIANMAAYVSPAALMDAAARSDGDIHRLERILSGYALAAINKQCQAGIRETMETRSNVISEALKGDDLDTNERAQLWEELAEIHTWLQKDDQAIGDCVDAQLCARFGDAL